MTEGRVPAARVRGCGAAPRGGAGRRGGASGYPGGLAGKAGPGAGCWCGVQLAPWSGHGPPPRGEWA